MVHIEEGQMIPIDMCKPCLRLISLVPSLVGSDEALWDGEHSSDAEDLVGTGQITRGYEHLR